MKTSNKKIKSDKDWFEKREKQDAKLNKLFEEQVYGKFIIFPARLNKD